MKKKILFLTTMTPHHYYLINRVIRHFKDIEFKIVFEDAELQEEPAIPL